MEISTPCSIESLSHRQLFHSQCPMCGMSQSANAYLPPHKSIAYVRFTADPEIIVTIDRGPNEATKYLQERNDY